MIMAQPSMDLVREHIARVLRAIGFRYAGLDDVTGNDAMKDGAIVKRSARVEGCIRDRAFGQADEIRNRHGSWIGLETCNDFAFGGLDLGVQAIRQLRLVLYEFASGQICREYNSQRRSK